MARRNNNRNGRGIRSQQPKRTTPATAIVAVVALLLFGGVAAWAFTSGDGGTQGAAPSSAATDGGTTVIEGSVHTVRHYNGELPASANPQGDGLPTLVWFSGTWCHFCHHMSDFAYPVAEEFDDRFVFIEKSVDHDRDAALRFRVRGTPTFVMLDPSGEEVGRFNFQTDAAAFRQAIRAALEVT